jgi:primary-amine oxidase
MPVDSAGFVLKPYGFFDRNPTLDIPPSHADHCAPGPAGGATGGCGCGGTCGQHADQHADQHAGQHHEHHDPHSDHGKADA